MPNLISLPGACYICNDNKVDSNHLILMFLSMEANGSQMFWAPFSCQ